MKDEQRTEMIMDWLENRMNAGEASAFEEEMSNDAELAMDCAVLSELTSGLRDMDADFEPSADFHQNLMARLSLENEQTERKLVSIVADESKEAMSVEVDNQQVNNGTKNGNKGAAVRSLLSAFRRKPLIPVAAVCCVVVIGLVIGLGGGGGSYERNYMSGGGSSGSPPMSAPASTAPMAPPIAGGGPMYDQAANNYETGGVITNLEPEMQYKLSSDSDYVILEQQGEARAEEAEIAADSAGYTSATSADGGGAPAQSNQAPSGQKIIRSGNIRMEVEHYGEAAASIKSLVNSLGGYVTSENSYVVDYADGRERRYGNISVKVPFDRYEQLFQQTQSLGKVMESGVWADDVTAQYVDLQARIAVFETKYQRLLALLQQSGELETILKIENELASTNADLESLKGQMRYLLSRTDYSTLDINLMEKPIETVEIRATGFAAFGERVGEAFVTGVNRVIRSIGNLIVWLARNIIGLIVFALILWLVWLLGYRRWRKRRNSGDS